MASDLDTDVTLIHVSLAEDDESHDARHGTPLTRARDRVLRILAAHYLLVPLFCFFAVFTAIFSQAHVKYQGASLGTWSSFGLTLCVLFAASLAVLRITSFLLCFMPLPYKVQYIFDKTRQSSAWCIWSLLALLTWQTYFDDNFNPLSYREDDGTLTERKAMNVVMRFLIVNLIISIMLLISRVAVVRLKLQRRAHDYLRRVNKAIAAQGLLEVLTKKIKVKDFRKAHLSRVHDNLHRDLLLESARSEYTTRDPEDLRRLMAAERIQLGIRKLMKQKPPPAKRKTPIKREPTTSSDSESSKSGKSKRQKQAAKQVKRLQYATLPADATKEAGITATNLENAFEALFEEPEVEDLEQFLEDTDRIQTDYLRACGGNIEIKTKDDAIKLGHALFNRFCSLSADLKLQASILRFGKELQSVDTEEHDFFKTCRRIFDPQNMGTLTRQWLISRCLRIYTERKHLARALSDLDSLIISLDQFLTFCVGVISLFVVLIVFSQGVFSELVVSASAVLLAFGFVFADLSRTMFNCFIFTFIRHPYDVGDRVVIRNGDNNEHLVLRISLLTTTFHHWNGKVVTMPNHMLFDQVIENMRRPTWHIGLNTFMVSLDTPSHLLDELEHTFMDYIRGHPNEYDAELSHVQIYSVMDMNKIQLVFHTIQRGNWQNAEYLWRRTTIYKLLKAKADELGIKYYKAPQPVMLKSDSQARNGSGMV